MPALTQATADKATAITKPYNDAVSQVRNNFDLTEDAKRRRMAQLYLDANQRIEALRQAWLGDADSTATKLNKDVFGSAQISGADAISVRDADDRAAQLETPAEALQLLERAEANSDKVLARAIAQRAWSTRTNFFADSDWINVVLERYVSTRPDVAAKVNAMLDAEKAGKNDFVNGGYFVVFKPAELANLTDSALAALVKAA